jgi:hypothetical protein
VFPVLVTVFGLGLLRGLVFVFGGSFLLTLLALLALLRLLELDGLDIAAFVL